MAHLMGLDFVLSAAVWVLASIAALQISSMADTSSKSLRQSLATKLMRPVPDLLSSRVARSKFPSLLDGTLSRETRPPLFKVKESGHGGGCDENIKAKDHASYVGLGIAVQGQ